MVKVVKNQRKEAKVVKTQRKKNIEKAIGKKPKKALSGYVLFIQNYLTNSAVKGKQIFANGVAAWRALSPEQKKSWNDRAQRLKPEAEKQLKLWKEKKALLKRPGSSFTLYTKAYWGNNGASLKKLQFGAASQRVATSWNELAAREKEKYAREFRIIFTKYSLMSDIVSQTGVLDMKTLKAASIPKLQQIHAQVMPL